MKCSWQEMMIQVTETLAVSFDKHLRVNRNKQFCLLSSLCYPKIFPRSITHYFMFSCEITCCRPYTEYIYKGADTLKNNSINNLNVLSYMFLRANFQWTMEIIY